jgi:penicillin-binding protein 1A
MPSNTPTSSPRPRHRSWWRILVVVALIGLGLLCGVAAGAIWYVAQDLPSLDSLEEYQPSLVSRVYADDDQVIGQYYVERRLFTPLPQIPQHLKDAVIAVEDVRFFEHPGLDIIGMARAFVTNLRRGSRVEGASTITQQLTRSLFLSPERTYIRKVRELVLAYQMELVLTKEQILELYLNQIYFGQGAYGVRAAGLTYFGKELRDLSLAECAFLAGLPKSPTHYAPFKNPERGKKRQEHVLDRMEETGFISTEQHQQAAAYTLTFRQPSIEQLAPHFVEYVRQALVAKHGETAVYKGGLDIHTTLNVVYQKAAEQAVQNGLRQLDKRQGWRGPLGTKDPEKLLANPPAPPVTPLKVGDLLQGVVMKIAKDHVVVHIGTTTGELTFDNMAWARRWMKGKDPTKDFTIVPNLKTLLKPGDVIEVGITKIDQATIHLQLEQTPVVEGALLAIDPRTGAIRAMVGGYDFARSEYNRAMQSKRQPGSAFKPVIYATALNDGLSPSTLVLDAPVVYENEDPDKTWKPENYEKKFYGAVTLREALAHSRNLATVRLLDRVGIRGVVDFARAIGITSPLNQDMSLALGSSSLTLSELVSAYGVFANQGVRLEPYAITSVQMPKKLATIDEATLDPRQVISRETAYLITSMLQDVVQRGTGTAAKTLERPIAGKTGTTNDYSDAWFIGYTPTLVVGVWVGFDDLRTIGETESGAHAALPIWIDFMKEALKNEPAAAFEIPDEIQFVKVDPATGMLSSEMGAEGVVESFAKGSEPTQSAPSHIRPMDFYNLDQLPETTAQPTTPEPKS